MAELTALELAHTVVTVMQDVLIHQRGKWGPLLGHQRQYEGWWKAEFALALESWAMSFTPPMPTKFYWVVPEAKPRDAGLGTSAQAVDLAVVPHSHERDGQDMEATPRVWIEIKERGDWWGNADKAFGTANRGLRTDLIKWHSVPWTSDDVVVASQLLSCIGTWDGANDGLPDTWCTALDAVAAEYPRFVPPRVVGYAVPAEAPKAIRWVRLEVFTIHGPIGL
jgi:hypothetical protein